MGTYDDTCNLTRLPILGGEEIVAIVLFDDYHLGTFRSQIGVIEGLTNVYPWCTIYTWQSKE